MPSLLHPGVYVREIPSGARSIEGVPTSITIFVGETERGPVQATRIRGRTDYERLFGGYRRRRSDFGDDTQSERLLMPYAMDAFFGNGGTNAYILRLYDRATPITDPDPDIPDPDTAWRSEPGGGGAQFIEASSPGYWGNHVSVAAALSTDASAATDRARMRLAVFYTPPGSTTSEPVEEWDHLSVDPRDENYIVDVLRRSRYIRWRTGVTVPASFANLDNEVISPRFPTLTELETDAVTLSSGAGGDGDVTDANLPTFLTDNLLEVVDASLMVAASARMLPDSSAALSRDNFVTFQNIFVAYVSDRRPQSDLFFIGDLPAMRSETDPVMTAIGLSVSSTDYNAVYWPHVSVSDPDLLARGQNPSTLIPPAAFVAGVYARTDGRRGVWKAPAGVEAIVNGARSFSFDVLDRHQDTLNPRAVNALRAIPAGPVPSLVVWGARTRRPTSEWRYVSVRRTAIFLRLSIYNGIQWAVFEPNDYRLWQTLRNTIGAFMETQFRNGAFAGETSSEAYFVKVDAETTTPDDQAAGIVNILVGFAPLRPAEFVVVSLQQMAGQSR